MNWGYILMGVFLLRNTDSFSVKNNFFDKVSGLKEQTTNGGIRTGKDGCHIHVTMHVYSGRPDPTWLIPYSHPAYTVITQQMQVIPARPLPSRLGYKGFSLVHVLKGVHVDNGSHFNRTITSFPDWELFLLRTSEEIADDIRLQVRKSILDTAAERKRRSRHNPIFYNDKSPFYKTTTVGPGNQISNNDMLDLVNHWGLDESFENRTSDLPQLVPTRFEPHKWNQYSVKKHNNCYNYANNRITDTFAQPGRAGNCQDILVSNGTDIETRAQCDGLKVVFAANKTALPDHRWNLVALVFWPPTSGSDRFDFHWYRLDGDGRWSHKPGKASVTKLDQSGYPITDPRHADRGPYTEFVGFLETRLDKVIIN